MKYIAGFFNIGLLGVVVFALAQARGMDKAGVFIALLLTAAAVSNIIALFVAPESKSWLFLFLKRKTLEEQQKIKALESPR